MGSLSAAGVPTSPPPSTSSPPQNMTPGPPHPYAIAPAGRTQGFSAPLPQMALRSPDAYSTSYNHPYATSSTSPPSTARSLQETQASASSALPGSSGSPTQISSSTLNATKRAYRQRRKDPSCDACRERKVKCDATETAACSECSSRNHKCQFTKETNRRMSSIKQVQDLQSRIADLTEENLRLKRAADSSLSNAERSHGIGQHSDTRLTTATQAHRNPPPALNNFDHVRSNIRKHSRGIFDSPFDDRIHNVVAKGEMRSPPELPPREDFARLSHAYFYSIHEMYPVVHWPTFQHEVEQVYTSRSFQGQPQEWVGLFFAVMACGSLQTAQNSAASPTTQAGTPSYYDIAARTIDPIRQRVSTTQATLTFLLTVFAFESNTKSTGAILLGWTIRLVQLLILDPEATKNPLEAEVRRRLWWSTYILDRVTSLGTDLPMLISDDHCDIAIPSSFDDIYVPTHEFTRPPQKSDRFTGFAAAVQVARLYPKVHRALTSAVMAPKAVLTIEEQFHSTLLQFPDSHQPSSDAPLEATALPPLITLQTARFLLYRRNISPVCGPAERAEALRRCTRVGQDTAKYISRVIHSQSGPSDPEGWRTKLAQVASNMTCLHVWRCMLVLCLCGDYEAALVCLRLAAAIGTLRKINIACGKNLAFFLDRLQERMRNGHHQLENDQELLAYASGDLQGNKEHSWVWAGSESAALPTTSPTASHERTAHLPEDAMQGVKHGANLPLRPNSGSPGNESAGWIGWTGLEHSIHRLIQEHHARVSQPAQYYPPPHNFAKRVQLTTDAPGSPTRPGTAPPAAPSGTSRISIANII